MLLKLITCIFVFGVIKCSALHCFECSSEDDESCVDLKSSDSQSPYYRVCDGTCFLSISAFFVRGSPGLQINRECASGSEKNSCETRSLNDSKSWGVEENCYCKSDGCNFRSSLLDNSTKDLVNWTYPEISKPNDSSPLNCFQCSTEINSTGCGDIKLSTVPEIPNLNSNPNYKPCVDGSCSLKTTIMSNGFMSIERECINDSRALEGCTNTPQTESSAGEVCVCRSNGCNGGDHTSKINLQTEFPSVRLHCFQCSTEETDLCANLTSSDRDSPYYKPCKKGTCQMITTVDSKTGSKKGVVHRDCVWSLLTGCTSSGAKDSYKIPFLQWGLGKGCLCQSDGCNGGDFIMDLIGRLNYAIHISTGSVAHLEPDLCTLVLFAFCLYWARRVD